MRPDDDKKLRMCPICGAVLEARLCPTDQIATLLVDPPRIDASRVEEGTLVDGRYLVEELIGRGGFGTVFRAQHTGTGQKMALKCLSTVGDTEEIHLKRFFQEARVTAGLRHPNTIRVFDFGQDDSGLIYLAMELLQGVTLKHELRTRRKDDTVFTQKEAIEIGIGICRSLAEAHRAGLVHRDLKPDNIFLQEVEGDAPTVKVLDFGIVKFANSTLTLGSDSGVPGTPAYMSPEQVVKRDLDGRSDLYSLGVVLYQLVAGKVPLRGESIVQTLYMHVHNEVPALKPRVRTPVTTRFIDLVHSTLEKNPANRPNSANEMRDELEQCLEEVLRDPPTRMIARRPTTNRPASNETVTTPPLEREASHAPSFFSSPGVESLDISMADVDQSRNALPQPPARYASWWVYVVLVVGVGILAGLVLVLLNQPNPEPPLTVPTVQPEHRPKSAAPTTPPPAVDAPLPEGDSPHIDGVEVAPAERAPAPRRKRIRRPRKRPRPVESEPAPPEKDEADEILDQKI